MFVFAISDAIISRAELDRAFDDTALKSNHHQRGYASVKTNLEAGTSLEKSYAKKSTYIHLQRKETLILRLLVVAQLI